jgi:hypothetical protein
MCAVPCLCNYQTAALWCHKQFGDRGTMRATAKIPQVPGVSKVYTCFPLTCAAAVVPQGPHRREALHQSFPRSARPGGAPRLQMQDEPPSLLPFRASGSRSRTPCDWQPSLLTPLPSWRSLLWARFPQQLQTLREAGATFLRPSPPFLTRVNLSPHFRKNPGVPHPSEDHAQASTNVYVPRGHCSIVRLPARCTAAGTKDACLY